MAAKRGSGVTAKRTRTTAVSFLWCPPTTSGLSTRPTASSSKTVWSRGLGLNRGSSNFINDLMDDQELLREYVERQSETAFAELVTRHINLVYATALRI